MRKLLLAICGLAALATTPVSAADGPACVRRNDIRDWSSPVRKTLILESYGHNTVKLTCISKGDTVKTRWAGEPGLCTIIDLQPYDGPVHPPNQARSSY